MNRAVPIPEAEDDCGSKPIRRYAIFCSYAAGRWVPQASADWAT